MVLLENKKLSSYLKDVRKSAFITQNEMSSLFFEKSKKELHPQYISNFERGLCVPSVNLIKAYIEVCGANKKKVIFLMTENYNNSLRTQLK